MIDESYLAPLQNQRKLNPLLGGETKARKGISNKTINSLGNLTIPTKIWREKKKLQRAG